MLQEEPTEIFIGNKSAIVLTKNSTFHDQSKYIDTKFHFIRECVTKKRWTSRIKYFTS
jgi:hypothetical protein